MAQRAITAADIEAAEHLFGISYTSAERELMVGNLDGQIAAAVSRRAVPLPNSVPMALRFDPRLPSFAMPAPGGPLRFSRLQTALPDADTDFAFATATELSAWIASSQLTSRQLTEIYLGRIAEFNPLLECVAVVAAEQALAEADAADALTRAGISLGPLHGIPYLLKDLFDAKGIATGWGAEPYRDRVPDADATVVRKLRAAGAVLLGKSTVGALAYNDIWYGGVTRNPWNLNEGSSGSSAGSASATAAGLCCFAIGTETLGSITSPSQRCGTTGLRPTFGRVSRAGGMALCWSLDKVGPICRSVEDAAMVLAAINGPDVADQGSIGAPFHFDAEAGIAGMRVGYLPSAFADAEADEGDRAALEAARRLGVELVEVSLPDLPYDALLNIVYAEAAAAFEELTLSGRDDLLRWQAAEAWPNIFRKARFLSAVDHVQLDRLRYQVMLALDDVFAAVDAMIGPFSTGPMLVASNFTGHPCLHLRSGFADRPTRPPGSLGAGPPKPVQPEDAPRFRVPQGISLWGRLYQEGPLLNLGMALERELGVALLRPTFAR